MGYKLTISNEAYEQLKAIFPEQRLLLNEPMENHTSFKIGGPADILLLPINDIEIQRSLKICTEFSIPVFVMGNGSNLLVRDKGIRGVVLKIAKNFSHIQVEGNLIKAQSGIPLSALAKAAVQHSLKGLEFASGIPGTLGGATTMNAGAYGGELKDVIVNVNAMDGTGNSYSYSTEEMQFGYRTSRIQTDKLIVLGVDLVLETGNQQESLELMVELAKQRREKQPLTYPSAGSTFKRPVGYYAGKLIQDCGLKGLRVGGAQISELHAGFIINLGGATARDVMELIGKVQGIIKDKYGVEMQPEVRIIGEE
ncbi:MAG: UDP-N-acetylmuramate dehydrogenase [Clostridiales bacterium]|nr:UDP-N-acetylmuramate dehydrogenase [Clostridiales bacterium]